MKQIAIFPYHPDCEQIIRNLLQMKEYRIMGLCSFQEDWTLVESLNTILGNQNQEEEALIANCDLLLLLDNYRGYKTDKYYQVIEKALALHKEIVVMPQLERELDLAPYAGRYQLLQSRPHFKDKEFIKINAREVKYPLETPVIAVTGMGKNCGKFETQMILYKKLKESGYKPAWISSNPLGVLYGGYSMPDFIYSDVIAFEKKVLQFNHFLFAWERMEQPDLFLIGIPEGISGFEAHEYNHFAEYPLVISSATSIDAAILCTYFMKVGNEAGIANLLQRCEKRFEIPVREIFVGRNFFEEDRPLHRITYLFLEESYLQKHFAVAGKMPVPIVPIWDKEGTEKGAELLIKELEENVDAI